MRELDVPELVPSAMLERSFTRSIARWFVALCGRELCPELSLKGSFRNSRVWDITWSMHPFYLRLLIS